MKLRRLTWIVCLFLLTGLFQASFLMADDEMDRERDLSRVRKKVEALRAWQLTEELDLNEETSARLFPAMRQADQERWKIEARNRELVREMARSLENRNPDPERINRILNELQTNRRELNRAEETHIDRVREILSPADTARYIMFQIRFQKEIRQKAAQVLRDRRQPDSDRSRRSLDRYDDRDLDDGRSRDGGSGGGSSDGGGGAGGRR